jgi:hypothetical protein
MSFHMQLLSAGKVCPLWSVPGCNCSIVIVDWLHCADLGVTADVIGNILFELVELVPGHDRTVRMRALWLLIQQEYDSQHVPAGNRFQSLRLKSFFAVNKSPKLKGKAAHIRYFVPVIQALVNQLMVAESIHTRTVVSCMNHLAKCYEFLQDFDAVLLDSEARKMAILYCALEKEKIDAGIQKRWKVKPKLHLFLELCTYLCLERQRGNPRNFWTYADESHGGSMRSIAVARGGRNTSRSSAYRLLSLWVCKIDMLQIMG